MLLTGLFCLLTVLNEILQQTATHFADGPFSVLVDHTRVLDFDWKRGYFRMGLERVDLCVHAKREYVIEDFYLDLQQRTPEEWRNYFYIRFEGKEGQNAGGMLLSSAWVMIQFDVSFG